MVLRARIVHVALAAFAAAVGLSSPALAQGDRRPDAGLVRECVAAMNDAADRAAHNALAAARRGVEVIDGLAEGDASDQALIEAARAARAAVHRAAGAGEVHIHRIFAECLQALRMAQAPRDVIMIVVSARERAAAHVRTATARANHAIASALREALAGGKDAGGNDTRPVDAIDG